MIEIWLHTEKWWIIKLFINYWLWNQINSIFPCEIITDFCSLYVTFLNIIYIKYNLILKNTCYQPILISLVRFVCLHKLFNTLLRYYFKEILVNMYFFVSNLVVEKKWIMNLFSSSKTDSTQLLTNLNQNALENTQIDITLQQFNPENEETKLITKATIADLLNLSLRKLF
jgi:hypothetical protein